MPKSPHSIKDMVMKYGTEVKKQLIEQFLLLKTQNNQKFSITFDESTSNRPQSAFKMPIKEAIEKGKIKLWNIQDNTVVINKNDS